MCKSSPYTFLSSSSSAFLLAGKSNAVAGWPGPCSTEISQFCDQNKGATTGFDYTIRMHSLFSIVGAHTCDGYGYTIRTGFSHLAQMHRLVMGTIMQLEQHYLLWHSRCIGPSFTVKHTNDHVPCKPRRARSRRCTRLTRAPLPRPPAFPGSSMELLVCAQAINTLSGVAQHESGPCQIRYKLVCIRPLPMCTPVPTRDVAYPWLPSTLHERPKSPICSDHGHC